MRRTGEAVAGERSAAGVPGAGERSRGAGAGLRPGTVRLFAVATAVSVANLYYAQPLLDEIAVALHISHAAAGLVVTLTQLGYAAGLMLLLPLGDLVRRRRLVTAMCAATAAALLVLAAAPSAPVLLTASVVVGAGATTAQILVPLAAELAAPHERGTVVGHVMSGLLVGILLARTAAGYLALLGGWRTVFAAAAALMLVLAAALRHRLPAAPPPAAGRRMGYPALLRSVLTLLREEPVLRLRGVLGALAFAVFSVLWTALTFLLTAAPYHYRPSTIGLFGLIGAGGAVAANLAGRAADRGGARRATAATAVLLTACWLPLLWGGHRLGWLIAGVLLLDLAVQGLHITNQSQVYALRPEARSRINSAYMTMYFLGGALGSVLAPAVYDAAGWPGVCALGAALGGCAVLVWLGHLLRAARAGR